MYEKYLPLTENPGDAKFQLAFFYFMAKRFDKADAIFKEVTSNPNVSPVAWRYWAYSLTEQGKPTDQNKAGDPTKLGEASKAFEQYFKKAKPEDIQGQDYAYLGDLYLYQKTPAGDSLANINFAKSLELDSMQFDVATDHAETYFRRKKYPEAIEAYKLLLRIKEQPSTADLFNLGRSYYYNQQFQQADSAFTKVAERAPNMTVGYQWAAKARQQIDSTGALGLANPMYDSLIEKSLANPEKYKKELIEAYYYFSMYYIGVKEDVMKAKPYLEKILEIDPNHAKAKEAIQIINEPPKNPAKGNNKGGK
jgi:tetratricopeptide (TPR) repeat protein